MKKEEAEQLRKIQQVYDRFHERVEPVQQRQQEIRESMLRRQEQAKIAELRGDLDIYGGKEDE
ncbi:hypothetical protein ACFL2D_00065 [Patescibacteria group bacterium]